MSIPEIIGKKRDGEEFTEEEIKTFIDAVVNDTESRQAQIGTNLFSCKIRMEFFITIRTD